MVDRPPRDTSSRAADGHRDDLPGILGPDEVHLEPDLEMVGQRSCLSLGWTTCDIICRTSCAAESDQPLALPRALDAMGHDDVLHVIPRQLVHVWKGLAGPSGALNDAVMLDVGDDEIALSAVDAGIADLCMGAELHRLGLSILLAAVTSLTAFPLTIVPTYVLYYLVQSNFLKIRADLSFFALV